MKLSIITPTILRTTLARTIKSVLSQTFTDYEHLIVVDRAETVPPDNPDLHNEHTRYIMCGMGHNDYGNTPRNHAGNGALGEYICYLDDDDYYIDCNVLNGIMRRMEDGGWPIWGILPLKFVFEDGNSRVMIGTPVQRGNCGTGHIVHKREVNGEQVRFPARPEYDADGYFVEDMKKRYGDPLQLGSEPLIVVNGASRGKWF